MAICPFTGLFLVAIYTRGAVVDHIDPGAWGGDWSDPSNLVTACWPCNARKGDLNLHQLGWPKLPISEQDWDGLTGQYSALWERAGKPKPVLHLSWMKCVGVQPPQAKVQKVSAVGCRSPR